MHTIQSPYSGEALVLDAETPFVYIRETDSCQNVSSAEIGQWLNSHGETRQVRVENLTELKASLAQYVDSRDALRWALDSIDGVLNDSLRTQAIELLEPLLNMPSIFKWLQDLFCLQAIPDESVEVARSSLNFANDNGFTGCANFYRFVLGNQATICHASTIWDLIQTSSLLGSQHRDLMDRSLGVGLFERIVSAGAKPDMLGMALLVLLKIRPSINSDIANKIMHSENITKVLSDYSEILDLEDIVESIDCFDLLSRISELDNSFLGLELGIKSDTSPFNISYPMKRDDLIVFKRGRGTCVPVSKRLAQKIETYISKPKQRTPIPEIEPLNIPAESGADAVNAMQRVQPWLKASKRIDNAGLFGEGTQCLN